jgi:hypothetical protein
MEARTSNPASNRRRTASRGRPRVALVLASALLVTSLFVDVGVARAEYPVGWQDPDLGKLGTCIGTCGSLFVVKSNQLFKYAAGLSCLGCLWDLAVEINGYVNELEPDCWTGQLGLPCGGEYYEFAPDRG